MVTRKPKKIKVKKSQPEFKPADILIKNRELFLYEAVTDESAARLIKEIKALNCVSQKPITLWINSGGGNTTDGLALINVMRTVKSPIITIINAEACSIAGHISVAGNKRLMVYNGYFMAHDMHGGIWGDYSGKVKYRADYIQKHFQILEDNYKRFTKLTKKDYEIARNGELWLSAEECLKKGIVDKILKP